ncbi:hypothetical protein [Faecalibacterium sp. An122]|uniref:hypothetical protein n=1 Tax=Faecalibacterium sp. An122 TaxID=1965551 RepID=UPI00117B73EE|nr:hypothetical protein [Faecalibacterium sp. An122]
MPHKILAPTPGRGFFLAVLFLSPFAVHSTGTPHRFFRKRGFSLDKRKDFPWLGRGSVSGWDKALFRPTGYGVSTGNRHTGYISRQGYSPKPGRQGAGSGVFTTVLD